MNDNSREETIRQLRQRIVVSPPKPISLAKQREAKYGVITTPKERKKP
jgi:hypothetical protein